MPQAQEEKGQVRGRARTKRFSDVRRQLIRRLNGVNNAQIALLRDQLWDVLIVRWFAAGSSVLDISLGEPSRNSPSHIEAAIRREMQRHQKRSE